MDYKIQKHQKHQLHEIKALLKENNLAIDDIESDKIVFFTATNHQKLMGVIGVEQYQNTALLRSLVVDNNYRNLELGKKLVITLVEFCKSNKIHELYLLTTTASMFFEKLEFMTIERINVPLEISKTEQFQSLCPSTAVVMYQRLNESLC